MIEKHSPCAARVMALGLVLLAAAMPVVAEPLPRFVASSVFTQNISAAPLHPQSASMISTLDGLGGWGFGRFQIDFSFHVVHADPGAPTRTIVEHSSWGYFSPDCDPVGTAIPVPPGAAIEGETDLTCDNLNNDCHLLVVQGNTLYEAYGATEASASEIETVCLAVWHLDAEYPEELRGDHCTSADAAGFPISPLLFNADDLALQLAIDPTGGGDLGHAIRFILPNDHMANDPAYGGVGGRLYVRPATHAGGPSGPSGSVPYGVRMRLRADFPDTGYNPAARVLLNTFKRYGIVLSDGGSVALTGQSDAFTTTKWADLSINEHVFWDTNGAAAIEVTDFEVIDTGPPIGETWDCVRTTIAPGLFGDGFESGTVDAWSSVSQ